MNYCASNNHIVVDDLVDNGNSSVNDALANVQPQQSDFSWSTNTSERVHEIVAPPTLSTPQQEVHTNELRLKDMERLFGTKTVQVKGQRITEAFSHWFGPTPGLECEVYVGRLPSTIYEDQLFPLFAQVGQIYEMRLMMQHSGENRGFYFVRYTRPEHADEAVKVLNNYQVAKGCRLRVAHSVNNLRLLIENMPRTTEMDTFIRKSWSALVDLQELSIFTNLHGFPEKQVLLAFKTHKGALTTYNNLIANRQGYFGRKPVKIVGAQPQVSFVNVRENNCKLDHADRPIMRSRIILGDNVNDHPGESSKSLDNTAQYANGSSRTRGSCENADLRRKIGRPIVKHNM